MQAEQIRASVEVKGTPQTVHDGPAYRLMLPQQPLQRGAYRMLSVAPSHEGQREGNI